MNIKNTINSVKKLIISASIIIAACAAKASKPNPHTDTFKVWGNCGMCEKKIEEAASKIKGVIKADWIAEKGQMILIYNPAQTNVEEVQKAIAAVGYDTEKVRADDKVYNKLHGCCQYEREK